jgi:hypothetical protein
LRGIKEEASTHQSLSKVPRTRDYLGKSVSPIGYRQKESIGEMGGFLPRIGIPNPTWNQDFHEGKLKSPWGAPCSRVSFVEEFEEEGTILDREGHGSV